MPEATTKLLVQRLAGKRIPKRAVVPADVVERLLPLLVGQVEVYDFATEGGTETSITPQQVRRIRLFAYKVTGMNQYIGASFTIPHAKPTVQFNEIVPLVVGKFNAGWNNETKAENVKLLFERIELPSSEETSGG